MNECKGCRFWDEIVPDNLGLCSRLGVLSWPDSNQVSINYSAGGIGIDTLPLSDFDGLRTLAKFGCVGFEPRAVGESAVSRARQAVQQAIAIDEYLTERLTKKDGHE